MQWADRLISQLRRGLAAGIVLGLGAVAAFLFRKPDRPGQPSARSLTKLGDDPFELDHTEGDALRVAHEGDATDAGRVGPAWAATRFARLFGLDTGVLLESV